MNRTFSIAGAVIDEDSPCYVIAEIGHNHQGSLEKAKSLFRAAKECGVDAVKLQKRSNRTLFTKRLYEAPYDNENSFGLTYGQHREALEFDADAYKQLRDYARGLDVTFFATAFDESSADLLAEIDLPAFKIASGDLTNTPLLRHVAGFGKPLIISTGGAAMADVARAVEAIRPVNGNFCILQCTAGYPVESEQMNLRVISAYRERFPQTVIGLSDHQSGISAAVIAYTLGARVVEKHFTLNRAWKGTDQAFSLEPTGMRKLVRDLRRARESLGDGVKAPLPCEAAPLLKMSKKLVAARHLPAGTVLASSDLATKSPGDGLPPYYLDQIVGKRLINSLKEEDDVTLDNLA